MDVVTFVESGNGCLYHHIYSLVTIPYTTKVATRRKRLAG